MSRLQSFDMLTAPGEKELLVSVAVFFLFFFCYVLLICFFFFFLL